MITAIRWLISLRIVSACLPPRLATASAIALAAMSAAFDRPPRCSSTIDQKVRPCASQHSSIRSRRRLSPSYSLAAVPEPLAVWARWLGPRAGSRWARARFGTTKRSAGHSLFTACYQRHCGASQQLCAFDADRLDDKNPHRCPVPHCVAKGVPSRHAGLQVDTFAIQLHPALEAWPTCFHDIDSKPARHIRDKLARWSFSFKCLGWCELLNLAGYFLLHCED